MREETSGERASYLGVFRRELWPNRRLRRPPLQPVHGGWGVWVWETVSGWHQADSRTWYLIFLSRADTNSTPPLIIFLCRHKEKEEEREEKKSCTQRTRWQSGPRCDCAARLSFLYFFPPLMCSDDVNKTVESNTCGTVHRVVVIAL